MTVGIVRLTLYVAGSQSLKEKRMVLRRLKDRVRERFGVAVSEVGDNDVWQRAQVGLAVVGKDRAPTEAVLDGIVRFVKDTNDVTNVEREIQTFNDTLGGLPWKHWEG